MANFEIEPELLQRASKLAAEEDRALDDVISSALRQYVLSRSYQGKPMDLPDVKTNTKNPLLLIAHGAEALGELATEHNVSERSRDILNAEFADSVNHGLR